MNLPLAYVLKKVLNNIPAPLHRNASLLLFFLHFVYVALLRISLPTFSIQFKPSFHCMCPNQVIFFKGQAHISIWHLSVMI